MLIVTPDTVRNPEALKVRQLPRRFFKRVTLIPRGRVSVGLALRIMAEFQVLRYMLPLLPVVAIGLIWTNTALALSQAPLLMFLLIWWVEMRLLRVPAGRRRALIDPDAAARGLDLLEVRGRAVLARVAATRGMRVGQLHLVVEQSELGRLPPLTYVSVQSEDGPEVVALDPSERAQIAAALFQPPLDERLLHRINQAEDVFLRDVVLDARQVSAHARLAAALA
ncbi:MAG: hypothetical protein GW886_08220 [Rhodobacterales bacterium]|nr:hypothetical protein [Rhodobacterales bacterium]NCT13607.1 hypothetical protein [Rhodobacterales bacterium]